MGGGGGLGPGAGVSIARRNAVGPVRCHTVGATSGTGGVADMLCVAGRHRRVWCVAPPAVAVAAVTVCVRGVTVAVCVVGRRRSCAVRTHNGPRARRGGTAEWGRVPAVRRIQLLYNVGHCNCVCGVGEGTQGAHKAVCGVCVCGTAGGGLHRHARTTSPVSRHHLALQQPWSNRRVVERCGTAVWRRCPKVVGCEVCAVVRGRKK